MTGPGSELVEVVEPSGAVVDIVERRRMRAERLRHRCTYVAVVVRPAELLAEPTPAATTGLLHADDLVVVHQRAAWKDTYPSYWDLAFGGVCSVGEPWLQSAQRELAEEAGIDGVPLLELGAVEYEDQHNRIVGRVYLAAWPDEPVCNDGEVVAVDRVRLGDLAQWVDQRPVCPDSADLVVPRLLALMG